MLGLISALFEAQFAGIVLQALGLSVGVRTREAEQKKRRAPGFYPFRTRLFNFILPFNSCTSPTLQPFPELR